MIKVILTDYLDLFLKSIIMLAIGMWGLISYLDVKIKQKKYDKIKAIVIFKSLKKGRGLLTHLFKINSHNHYQFEYNNKKYIIEDNDFTGSNKLKVGDEIDFYIDKTKQLYLAPSNVSWKCFYLFCFVLGFFYTFYIWYDWYKWYCFMNFIR